MKDRLLRMPVIGTALRVQERYTEDAADSFAASIAFFGFLSLIPLILFGLSALGFVVRGDAGLEGQVIQAVRDAIPGFSSALPDGALETLVDRSRDNAGSFLSVGTGLLLFTGLKVIAGAQRALAVVFRMEILTGAKARLQQLLALVGLGLLALLGSAIGGSVGVNLGDGWTGVAWSLGLTVVAFVVDLILFLVSYRLLSPDPGRPAWRTLLPGALFAAIAWVALKAGGASLVAGGGDGGEATRAEAAGAALVAPIGILTLLYLAARVFMYGAELAALRGGITDDGAITEGGPLVEERPTEDVAPPPADLARLAGSAAVLALVAKVFGND